MTEEGLRAGAERIVAARAAVTKLDGLPDAERPRTLEDGYRMLRIATERWGGRAGRLEGRRHLQGGAGDVRHRRAGLWPACSRAPCMRAPRA